MRRQREHQAGNKAPLITGRFQAGQRLWTGSLLLFELAAGHLVAVGDEVVGLGEGLPVNDKLARDLVALQRLVPRHVVDLGLDAGPQLGRIFLPVSFCAQKKITVPTLAQTSVCMPLLSTNSMRLPAISACLLRGQRQTGSAQQGVWSCERRLYGTGLVCCRHRL